MEIPGLFGMRINDETLLQKGGSVMISFICWLGLYALQRLLPNSPSPEWRCRIITAIHGAIVTFLALYSQFVEGPDLFDIEPGMLLLPGLFITPSICKSLMLFTTYSESGHNLYFEHEGGQLDAPDSNCKISGHF